ncbi:GntR family transcriptional regulator [Micromonospora chersina]|uniref:GntR family transcriptional regulator n=1 Tax=Micromonospora chersina TaxID=47854 RepID=UPI003721B2CC
MAEELQRQIVSGELAPGSPLPSETELSQDFGISRTSVRNAIRELKERGLVRSEQGKGTFVRPQRPRVRRVNTSRYQWEKDRVKASEDERRSTGGTERDTGLEMKELRFHVDYQTVPASGELADALGIPEDTPVLQRTYQTTANSEDAALSMSRSYIPLAIIEGNPDLLDSTNEPWPGGTQHQLSTVGVEIAKIIDEVQARPPLPDEREVLKIDATGVSVLALRKTSIDTTGRVVEVADAVYAGDRTELVYEIPLKRWKRP